MKDVTLQVSEAIELINETLDAAFPFIVIEGEVASFKVNQGKFVFFDVKDESGSIGCFMMAFSLKFPLEDGMKVKILAQPKLTNWGKFSLTVREVMPVGEGSLKKSFELLKAKLANEGLFEESRKRPLPQIPKRIGVVSSSQAAGYADFIKILENRWGDLEIVLVDVPVQGMEAPNQIIGALKHLNELAEPVDVIAVLRGGGSADDLGAFSHEDVARAIAASRTPTIIGVGHEVDISLADLVADRRAATPSNAAEILVPDKSEVIMRAQRTAEMAHNGVVAAIRVFEEDRGVVVDSIESCIEDQFSRITQKLSAFERTLFQINPEAVLRRGYSIVRRGVDVIASTSDVILNDEVSIQLKDGTIGAKITDVSPIK
jgi:exodeoxyribonuclease VII large subunit